MRFQHLFVFGFAFITVPFGHTASRATIEEIVVIAHPLSSEGLAQPTTVLDGDALSRSLSGTLGETLVNQPGIHSSSFGQAVGRPVIHGLGGARVRIMEDRIDAMDVSVSSPDHATTIEPFLAQSVEVLKGPSTLLYGNGAIGGVVDVHSGRIPHTIPDRLEAKVELRAADNGDQRTAAARAKFGTGSLAFHLDGYHRDADDYHIPSYARSDAERRNNPPQNPADEVRGVLPGSHLRAEGGAIGTALIGQAGFVGAAVSRYEARYGLPGEPPEEGMRAPELDMDQTRFDLEAALNHPYRGVENINLRFGVNSYQHAEIEGSGEVGTTFDNKAIDGRLEILHQPIGEISGAIGLQAGSRDYASFGEEAYVQPVESTSIGTFWVGERSFSRVDLEAGLRYEHLSHRPTSGRSRQFDLLAASLGLIVPLRDAWTFAVQLDHSARAPGIEELYSNGPHLATRSFEQGDPDLDPERALSVSGTLEYESERIRAGISVYYMDFSDFIYQRATGDFVEGLPVLQWEQTAAAFHGIDGEVLLKLYRGDTGEISIRGFYDRVHGHTSNGAGSSLPRIPPERFGSGILFELGRFTASLDYARTRTQKNIAPEELSTEGYDDLRAYLGMSLPFGTSELVVFIQGRNLTDAEQRQHTSFIKDLAPQPGRTIEGGVRFTL